MLQRSFSALLIVLAALILFAVLNVGTSVSSVKEKIETMETEEPRFAGQSITSHGVTTERYLNEEAPVWIARHVEAIRASESTR